MLTIVTLAVYLSVVPLAGQSGTGLSESDLRGINEVSQSYAKAVLAREWKAVAALYTDDGVLYPPGEAAVKGRKPIESCLTALPPMTDFKLRTTKIDGRVDLAYVQGTYSMTPTATGQAKPVEESGYFLEIRRRQPDGTWLIAVHMLRPH